MVLEEENESWKDVMNLQNLSTHDNNETVNGENVERTYDLSNFIEMMVESLFPALINAK